MPLRLISARADACAAVDDQAAFARPRRPVAAGFDDAAWPRRGAGAALIAGPFAYADVGACVKSRDRDEGSEVPMRVLLCC